MTTELTSHIALIRAHCTTVIEQAKLATDGPWTHGLLGKWCVDTKMADDPHNITYDVHKEADALFIATSRQFTPAAAEAVLVALDKLQQSITLAEQVLRLPWGYEGDGGSVGIAEDIIETATEAIQSLTSKFDYLWK